jgi:hypothetical protein
MGKLGWKRNWEQSERNFMHRSRNGNDEKTGMKISQDSL